MFTKFAALAAAACVIAASPAAATTFNTTTVGANQGTSKTVTDSAGKVYDWFESATVDGINFSAFGFTLDDSTDVTPELARVLRFDKGLGVLNYNEGTGADGQHTIDNNTRYDFVALFFNKTVQLTGMELNAFQVAGQGPDKDAWIGWGTPLSDMTEAQTADFWKKALGTTLQVNDGVMPSAAQLSGKVGTMWLIGADRTATTASTRNDGFKLGAVTVNAVAAVPEPSSWGAMILGFGVAGAALRRRRTAVAFA